MSELKKCPFCGGKAELVCIADDIGAELVCIADDIGYVKCATCGIESVFDSEAATIAAWNRRADEWIPVSTLPKVDGKYLCSDCASKSGYMRVLNYASNRENVSKYDVFGGGAGFYDWDDETGFYCVTSVSHWMPLPEPPKGE